MRGVQGWWRPMQCFVCGEPMRVVMVEPHHLIDVQGFELRTFQCVGCGDVEKRPFFDSERTHRLPALVPAPAQTSQRSEEASEAVETAEASRTSEAPEAPDASEAPGGLVLGSTMKAILDGLVRLRGTKQSEH
jgi:hypothetical protein